MGDPRPDSMFSLPIEQHAFFLLVSVSCLAVVDKLFITPYLKTRVRITVLLASSPIACVANGDRHACSIPSPCPATRHPITFKHRASRLLQSLIPRLCCQTRSHTRTPHFVFLRFFFSPLPSPSSFRPCKADLLPRHVASTSIRSRPNDW